MYIKVDTAGNGAKLVECLKEDWGLILTSQNETKQTKRTWRCMSVSLRSQHSGGETG